MQLESLFDSAIEVNDTIRHFPVLWRGSVFHVHHASIEDGYIESTAVLLKLLRESNDGRVFAKVDKPNLGILVSCLFLQFCGER